MGGDQLGPGQTPVRKRKTARGLLARNCSILLFEKS